VSETAFEEVETTEAPEEVEAVTTEEPKETKKAKRAQLPAGFGTPIQFAKVLTAKLREEGTYGEGDEFKPQVVYSYITHRSKENPIPVVFVNPEGETVDEPTEGYRPAFRKNEDDEFAEALAWWDAKEQRKEQRKANAAEKAAKKASKADTKQEAEEVVVDENEVVEAE
jgi:hypothetical protein